VALEYIAGPCTVPITVDGHCRRDHHIHCTPLWWYPGASSERVLLPAQRGDPGRGEQDHQGLWGYGPSPSSGWRL